MAGYKVHFRGCSPYRGSASYETACLFSELQMCTAHHQEHCKLAWATMHLYI